MWYPRDIPCKTSRSWQIFLAVSSVNWTRTKRSRRWDSFLRRRSSCNWNPQRRRNCATFILEFTTLPFSYDLSRWTLIYRWTLPSYMLPSHRIRQISNLVRHSKYFSFRVNSKMRSRYHTSKIDHVMDRGGKGVCLLTTSFWCWWEM